MEFNTQNLQAVECDNEQTLCRNTTSCINVPAGVSVLNGMYIPGRTIVRRKPGWHTSRLEPQCWHISTPFLSVLSSEIFIQPKHRFSYTHFLNLFSEICLVLYSKQTFGAFFFNTTTYKQYILHLLQLCCCSSNQVCIDIILLLYHLYSEFCSVLYTALVLHFMCYFHIKQEMTTLYSYFRMQIEI